MYIIDSEWLILKSADFPLDEVNYTAIQDQSVTI
jgi:hypothetical protein